MKWHKFSTVITDATSKFRKIKASNYLTSGRYKIIDQSKEPVAGYTDDDSLINEQLRPILIFGDHTRILKYENDPIALGADGAKALWVDPNIADARYVYYYLRSVPIKEAGYSRHFKFLKEVKIPIPYKDGQPDFDYQTRVVYLLGKIEGMIALRKQHLQQLDSLLESVFLELFGDPVRNDKGWDIVPFHKVGKFISGGTPSKSRDDFWNGDFPWVSPKDMKTTKIDNAIDHISETVFEQTSLKRIAPNHLLIVVRGMILAHSFPVAINSVDIAINQDMKAIKPVKDINVVYLLNCLNSLKRQLLKLISTAGHGTRKFDSVSMEKLFIPKPPEDLQNQFVAIAEKIEILKSDYQRSLVELETLYGALGQKVFKGELDLSRVPMPKPSTRDITAVSLGAQTTMPAPVVQTVPAIHLPDTGNLLAALENSEARKTLVTEWLEAYRVQLAETPFSLQQFIELVQNRLAELHPDNELVIGASDYEHIKTWVFEALAAGTLTQVFDDAGNCIKLKAAIEQSPA
ncbi:restriction endonuclease subunit S [Escherichia coli]|uniref:Restriction endonuclease subunit S n=1 Tax=Escherichia coli TaxID=562 RepID=A0A2H4TUW9_ECOLX|nr:restriction endonuclease subunit S [Escherichia coli]ATZ33352.1 type I restriction endonuclease subunit S [Escherichia coli]AVS06777.1 restriction endonuclease subunit S [Escherichia coli]EED1095099.1 restriction endonuclease subunit S [Escherichia coli]EEU9342242.1 restriction endonuclease subunit S [Escherichia coli]EEW2530497.1 restriction endonuclease subunit S [Escherichia coli]